MLFTSILGTALAALAPVFILSLPPASSALVMPRNINATLVPASCVSACAPALSAQTTCGSNTTCLCTNANGASFAQYIDCAVGTDPSILAQSADHTSKCAFAPLPISSLALSLASPTGSATPAPIVDQTNDGSRSPTIQHPLALLVGAGVSGGWAALGM
ncbi:hypothetical protein B0H17DRAFT_1123535 [Mycena rosella]|uniref:Extracellular membrane protein CFEM domain-containing protein n=1 Tax=Mycena rosella TaxID=1033263 RepID=A0AAD7H1X1_MYCRO|nr:hypothetical protein B0H17DRAFT_1123535 [Mycena rosella]